jgi:FixJ family two-component response regulator
MPPKPLVAVVAVVDDDHSIRETTKDLLESAGLNAAAFASARALLDSGLLPHISCLIVDMRMPEMSGLALHEHLMASRHSIPTILVTAYPDERVRARAASAGVTACLAKPFTDIEVLGCVLAACPA